MMTGGGQSSLRARFTLAMLAWVIGGLLVVGISASALFRRHVEGMFHAELEEHLLELVALTQFDRDGRPRLARPLSDPRFGIAGSGYYWQVSRPGSDPLRSPSLGNRRLTARLQDQQNIVHDNIAHISAPGPSGAAMMYGITQEHADARGTLFFLIATDMRHLDDVVAAFRREMLVWLAALTALLIAGALIALRFATRPLDRLATSIARVRSGQAQRMGGAWPKEIVPLAGDLDRLIESREAMVAAARIEAGNLAHGLRTSLAVLADEAENLADHRAGKTLMAQCTAMARRLDWHLARARAAAGQGAVIETSLPDALDPLISAMRRLHAARSIQFTADGPPVRAAIDPDAFAEIMSNLLDNAGKWANAQVAVHWQATDGKISIAVIDDGPGIPAGTVDRLWKPGVRLDEKMPGHGLGLAIALDLAQAANGQLALGGRSDQQIGTQATLTLAAA
jgi:signal transduction histidine kinase